MSDPNHYFDPDAHTETLSGSLPHWRQSGVIYFVTFRLADSLPREKLQQWELERRAWLKDHPEPHSLETRRKYYRLFPQRLQDWLDAGTGSCILQSSEVKDLVTNALRHFDKVRYDLDAFVVAPNHVHALVTPKPGWKLSDILHSWKSFTSHEILKLPVAVSRLRGSMAERVRNQSRDGSATLGALSVWEKESFDHIVRTENSLNRFRDYIRAHEVNPNKTH
ncbi:MAG: transposase [Candidatus Sumerlaeaceae bacterium]|nr:transposase [Candidatus Sumerlaeaceae bacterium]